MKKRIVLIVISLLMLIIGISTLILNIKPSSSGSETVNNNFSIPYSERNNYIFFDRFNMDMAKWHASATGNVNIETGTISTRGGDYPGLKAIISGSDKTSSIVVGFTGEVGTVVGVDGNSYGCSIEISNIQYTSNSDPADIHIVNTNSRQLTIGHNGLVSYNIKITIYGDVGNKNTIFYYMNGILAGESDMETHSFSLAENANYISFPNTNGYPDTSIKLANGQYRVGGRASDNTFLNRYIVTSNGTTFTENVKKQYVQTNGTVCNTHNCASDGLNGMDHAIEFGNARIEEPSVSKAVDKTKAYLGEDLTYTITQTVPLQDSDWYYKSWNFEDTLPSSLTIKNRNTSSVSVKNGSTDVTSKFNISYSGNKLTVSAKTAELAKKDFYNKTYTLTFKATVNNNTLGNIVNSVTHKISWNNINKSSTATATTTPLVKVKYEMVGDVPSGAPSVPGEEKFDYNSQYNQKPKLADGKYGERGDICHFEGWNTNSDGTTLSGKWTDGTRLTKDTTLYGKWNCRDRWKDPTKSEDKEILELNDEITYKIENDVPSLEESEMTLFKYTSYEITDNLNKIFGQAGINVYRNEVKGTNNISKLFDISVNNNKVSIKAKTETLNDISFYGNKYIVVIKAKISDDYAVNLNNKLDEYKTKKIENVATLKIDDKPEWTKDTNKVEAEIEKVKIKYRIIGEDRPDESLTDKVPEDSEQTKGTSYIQEGPLTTRDKTKICTFNGWYSNEELTNTWKDGENLLNDLNLYGSWDCSELVNDIYKSSDEVKVDIGKKYEYKIKNSVPNLEESQHYKSYKIIDRIEEALEIEEDNIKVEVEGEDVTEKFNILKEGQRIEISAKDLNNNDFYGHVYEVIIEVKVKKDIDLSEYKKGNKYVIPNKATLYIVPKNGDESCIDEECTCNDENCYSLDSEEVDKNIGPVEIKYIVIGDIPTPSDPTPEKDEVLPGSVYNAKKGLTTKDNSKICIFKGWYNDRELTNKYKDGSIIEEDKILYGSWDCKKKDDKKEERIISPDTKSNNKIPLVVGFITLIVGLILYINRNKILLK